MPYPQTSGKGATGAPGIGITSSTITYQVSTDGAAVPAGTWSATFPIVPKGQYLWTRTVTNFTNNTTTTAYSVAYSATDGATGLPGGAGAPGVPGTPGADGVGMSSSTIMYVTANSANTPPTSGWSATMPSISKGRYLWTRTATSYTDGSTTTAYSLGYVALDGSPGEPGSPGSPGTPGTNGTNGTNGVGVSSSAVTYQASASGTTIPTGTWVTAIPTVTKGQYLWGRTVITYSDATTTTTYSVAYQPADGTPGATGSPGSPGAPGTPGAAGTGIASAVVTYQTGTSGTTAPTGTWTAAVPTVTKGQYLWTRTVLTMTDAATSTAYSVAYQAVDGSPGTPGTNGTSYNPQTPISRTIVVATAYQHTDTTKPYKVTVNARATQTVTLAGTVGDKLELRIGPTAASVASNGSGGFSVGIWESGITGIAVMIGAAVADGAGLVADVPMGWYFSVNRLSGTSATIVSCFTQAMTA